MEPCCGIAKTAGRRAARRAIFRSGMVINVEIARIYDLIGNWQGSREVVDFGVSLFVIVDRVYCVVIVVVIVVVVDLEYCLKPTRAVKRG